MAERRRYTKREKVSAVTAALASSVQAASEQAAIPYNTLKYWLDDPEFADLRMKTREQLAEGSLTLANLAQAELQRKVKAGEVEPKDLAVIYGIAIDKAQLLAGHATARTETKALSDSLSDHEKQQFRDALDRLSTEPATDSEGEPALGAGAEVRE